MYKVKRADSEPNPTITMVIGIRCRSITGFLFMWLNIFSFILATKRANGCLAIRPGISSPFSFLLVSYWESRVELFRFVGHPKHVQWMQFVMRHSRALNLENEIYEQPMKASYINRPSGYGRIHPESDQQRKIGKKRA